MNSKRIVFLLLAVIVAGSTAFLARAWLQGERAAILAQAGRAPAPPPSSQKVLVASAAVRVGQIVKPDDLRWQPWPAGDLASSYVVEGKRPLNDFVGAVVRRPIAAGEPITEGKVVTPGTRGFMSAVLQPGTRAVSIPITATSAVSGFIYAGDRVDVLLTHTLNGPDGQHKATETILRNARVIAMDQKVDSAPGDKPDIAKTATLELTPKQSEIVTLADKMGDLSLVLRSLQENDDGGSDAVTAENAPAEPGDSFTRDWQVSPLISDGPAPKQPGRVVYVLRGSSQPKSASDAGSQESGDDGKPGEGKAPRTTTFTRTPSVSP
ncbi:MAG: Flp pilus assembly protein CpaB [Proteobacteria bacterium]|nr:Flp pilus assembly protein CpaB [Pseudomonadota bacterium]